MHQGSRTPRSKRRASGRSSPLFFNYAHEPLVVINPANADRLQHLVRNQLGFDLIGSTGLGERFELGLVAPLKIERGEFNELPTGNLEQSWKGGLGDLRLVPKVLLLERDTLRLGLAAPMVMPTADASELQGQKGFGVQPRLAADYAFESGTRLLANLGLNVRSRRIGRIEAMLLVRAGAEVPRRSDTISPPCAPPGPAATSPSFR
ncbi:transporter [Hyalangium minutum]|uniref:transporter n=1 Tax=Hyalangium minutum TaxID=394096 RepID=UPI0005C56D17|nr:transporter [Hyalangium minutum]